MIEQVITACRKSCLTKDLPVFPNDLSAYQERMKQPKKGFSMMTETDKTAYLRYIFIENKLNELTNSELVFYLFCHLIEKGAASLRNIVQSALDMAPSADWNCRHIQALIKSEHSNNDLLKKLCIPSKNFKPIQKQQLEADCNTSQDSLSTQESDSDDIDPPKRLEPNKLVFQAQTLLHNQGFHVQQTGVFDAQTETAIRQYQTKNKVLADGLVTKNLINSLEGKGKKTTNSLSNNNKIGGVNLNTKVNLIKQIRGIRLNPKSQNGLKFLVDAKALGNFSGVDLDDLALCLSVYYDQTIKYKTISFSLDPWEEKNPDGEFQRKVLYPDILEKKKVLEGSRFSELMFECDYIMKQMSLGLQPDCKTPFKYPKELIDHGLKPIPQIIEEVNSAASQTQQKRQTWSRLWLVCNQIEGIVDSTATGGIFLSNNVKVEVHARQMEQDAQGKLMDKKVQDKSDPCYMFAKKFTELYPLISKFYPCFEEIKKLYRASALAKWIAQKGIAIDLNKLKETSKGQFLDAKSYSNRVNSIRNQIQEDLGIEERKVPVDIRTVAIRGLKQSKLDVTEENIKKAIPQLIKQNDGSNQFFDIQRSRKVAMRYVMGGVDMNCEIVPPQATIKKSVPVAVAITATSKVAAGKASMKAKDDYNNNDDEESKWDDDSLSSVSTSMGSIDEAQVREEEFPFALSQNCSQCDKILILNEMKYPLNGQFFCNAHHPRNCFYCQKIVDGVSCQMKGRADLYDAESFVGKNVIMHPECNLIFQNKCIDKANFTQQNEQIAKINASCLSKVKENIPTLKALSEMQLKTKGTFVCELCKKNNRNVASVCCSLCGLVNSGQVNACLKEKFNQK